MAPWNINRATWLKFLADSWTYESATGEPPVPFANSADDGLCDPLTAEQAVEWVTKTKFQVVALPGGRKGRGGNEAENVLLLAHNFVLETLEEQDEEEVTLFLAMAGLGDEASPISIDLNKLSSPLSEYISFKEENEEDQGLESLRPPSFKQFLEAPLDSEDLIGLKGKRMSTRTGTKIGWLLEKGSAITLTPYLIQEVLQEFYEDENTSLMRISARELLYGFCKMVKMQVDSKSLTAKKAQEKYFHHLLFLWTLAQPEVVIEQYPFSSYHPDDFVFDMDTEDPLRQLAKIIKLKSKWQENIKGQEEESGDEVGKKTPARMMKKKESGEEKKQEKDRATSDLSGDESEDETETGRDKLVAKKRKAKAVQSSDDSSSDEEPEVDFDEMYRDALAQIKDPVQRLKFMGERESLKIQQRQMKRQKKAARYAKQTRNFTENQTAHLKNQADTMAEMKELQIKENQRKKMEKSVIKKWTVENRTLLKRLSSIDFQEEGEPSPTALARETFMESQNFGNAHKRFETASARWAFKIIPSGFAQLVSSGFYNPNVSADPFAGLSCLIFCPDHALSEMESKEGRMRLLAQALAETKLTDDAIKELARKEIYVPRSGEDGVNDVINALSAAMWTAENYLGARSIGTIPYRHALNWVVRNRLDFRDAEAESIQEQFFLRFLHRVDKMFHDFCTILLRCEGERPMEQAREKLENFCGEEFKTAFGGLARGDMPCLLRLPRLIGFQLLGQKSSRANRSNTGGGGPRSGGRSDSPETGRGKGQRDRPQEEKPKDQWMRCSEKIPDAWKLPSGKNYADALGRRAPTSHKEGFPTFPHHSDKKKGECAPCPRYLVLGSNEGTGKRETIGDFGNFHEDLDYQTREATFFSRPDNPARKTTLQSDERTTLSQPSPDHLASGTNPHHSPGGTTSPWTKPLTSDHPTGETIPPSIPGEQEKRTGEAIQPKPPYLPGDDASAWMIQPGDDRDVAHHPVEDITWEDGKYVQGMDPVHAIVGFETVHTVISDNEEDEDNTKINQPNSKSTWSPYRNRERDPRGEAARRRNLERVEKANRDDEQIVGKFLPDDIRAFFSFEWDAPELEPKPSEQWIDDLKFINRKEPIAPKMSRLSFDLSPEGLSKNLELLREANFDLTSLLDEERGTTVGHGSEFRPVEDLRLVLRDHPYVDYLDQVFTQGMNYHYKRELQEHERREELEHVLSRGNHKSALNHKEKISKLLAKDVKHGFAMPLPAEAVKKIPGALVQPCGCAEQFSLEGDGSRVPKLRLTHDLSFSLRPDMSVNDRVDMSQYPEMVYGFCLSRIIHFIVSLRAEHPDKKIFLEKADYSEAYRRISHHPEATATSIIVWEDVAYLMLRLAFGGSPNPACFSGFSETLTDLANELSESDLQTDEFSLPTVTPELQVPEPYPKDDEPLAGALKPAVHIPLGKGTRKDCFLDDVINVILGTEENLQREPFIVPLAVDLMSRRHLGDEVEPIFRKALLQYAKRLAEGRPGEIRIVLGWGLDTRLMIVFLPDDKFLAWRGDLKEAIEKGKVCIGDLESLLGRLNHAALIIPLGRHFLGCIRRHIPKSGPRLRMKKLIKRLSPDDIEDLKVWEALLKMAHKGIPMDILTVRHPTHLAWTDSCPFGLGGYTLKGRAFRLKIPKEASFYGESVANNFLEFLAQTIGILLIIKEAQEEGMKFPCFHSLGDNTTAIGWLFRSGRLKKDSVYYEGVRFVARHLAHSIIEAKAQLCPQHWAGKKNIIPDILSFHGTIRGRECSLTVDNPPNDVLTQRICEHYPQLVPESFQIYQLPPDITSFVCRALQILESSWIRNKKRGTKRLIERGEGGRSTWTDSESTIRSLIEFPDTSNQSFSNVSLSNSEKESSIDRGAFLAGAFEARDPPPNRQAAITPELLKEIINSSKYLGGRAEHMADLIVGAFFFAMRACEFSKTHTKGKTKRISLDDIVFRDQKKRVIKHDDPNLLKKAKFVTITFRDQKNGKKMDKRTQGRSGHKSLCPVIAWGRAVQRKIKRDGNLDVPREISSLGGFDGSFWFDINSENIKDFIRSTCKNSGGKERFGFGPSDIGTRSIRSGAAMALFLMDHSVEKIKILGRWSSDAFLVYIRPQVLEWTSIMASDMAKVTNFIDLAYKGNQKSRSADREAWRELGITIPSFRHSQR